MPPPQERRDRRGSKRGIFAPRACSRSNGARPPRPIAGIPILRHQREMHINRRHLVSCLLAGLVGGASDRADATGLKPERTKSMPVEFPPFELRASTSALQQLTSGISSWRVERLGNTASNVWLRNSDGATWLLGVDQRDVQPMFEVFTLAMLSISELHARWKQWKPSVLPEGVPEWLEQLLTTRPAEPVEPTDFEPWPLRSWRTQVVRRAEFIVESGDFGPTFGNNPKSQSSARPRQVPRSASAFCEVAAGVLFTSEGHSLLLAVDWMPMNLLVLEDAAKIRAFVADCELVSMVEYLRSQSA